MSSDMSTSTPSSPGFATAAPSNPVALAPPPPALPLGPQGFQAAKYFSYIFFAVAVAVIAMFAMLVCYHMLVRRRAMHLRRRNIADFRVPQREDAPLREIPLKQGFLVHNPNGLTLVAWDPEGPDLKPESAPAPATGATARPAGCSSAAAASAPEQASATLQQRDDSAAVALEEGRLSRGLQAEHVNSENMHRLHMFSSPTY